MINNKKKKLYIVVLMIIFINIIILIFISRWKKTNKINPIKQISIQSEKSYTITKTYDDSTPLLNPGKGFVLRDSMNTKNNDVVSVIYYRFNWSEIEPMEKQYNWNIIDEKIDECEKKGKKFAFGIMNANTTSGLEYVTPKWVFDKGADYYESNNKYGKKQIIPNWNDKIFISEVSKFVEVLAEKYDGNSNIEYIDIRSYGNWGEQHMWEIGGENISADELMNNYIKVYYENFRKTKLVTPWGGTNYLEVYKQAVDNGISIRRDGIFLNTNGKEVFKYAYNKVPTIFEYYLPYDQLKTKEIWNEDILNKYIEEWKPSYLEYFPEMYDDNPNYCKYLVNKIGYYFKFNRAEYKNSINDNENIEMKLTFKNEGVAPLYEPCSIYIGLMDNNYNLIKKYKTNCDAKKWAPNIDVEEKVTLNFEGVETGNYILAVGLFYNDNDEKPTYLLGSTGKTVDNWYVYGQININNISNEQKYLKNIEEENNNVKNNYFEIYKNANVNSSYISLANELNDLAVNISSINKNKVNYVYNLQYSLINSIIDEYNTQNINISNEEYKKLITDLLNISDQYKELFSANIIEDDISNETVQIDINKVIDKYNENSDLEMPICVELINNIKEIYNNNIQNEELSYNYLNKRRIQNTCDIISKLLENEIKINVEKESKSIIVTYNTNLNTLTNKDVTAQIKLPSNKCSIENNPSNTKYTFTENGTKNITINIRGYKYNYDIKITNIDKTLPQITGIEQDGQYQEKVTPQITDENLSEIKLLKDGQTVKDYEANASITQEGIYQLIAKDGAGNETTIKFIIAYPEDEKYIIENNTVKNINCGTKISTLKERLQVSENYKIKRNNNEVKETENIATGDILETESGITYTLIVKGDINKDGNVNVRDLVKMRKYILLGNNLDEIEKMAADTNVDGKEISVRDLVKLRIMLLISNTNVT